MSRKQVWELGAALALLFALMAVLGGWLYYRRLNEQLVTILSSLHGTYVDDKTMSAVRTLVRRGASARTRGKNRITSLQLAAATGDATFARELLDRGADVNGGKWPPLADAALEGHLPIVELLLAHGAKVEDETSPPLVWAASNGYGEIIARLIAAGANVNARAGSNHTALSAAQEGGYKEVVRLLKRAGATR